MTSNLKKWIITASMSLIAFSVCQAQVYEVYDTQLNLVQKINNDHIFLLSESIRVSDKDQKLKLLNNNYEPFLNLEGSEIYQYLSPWILVKGNDKYGAYHEYGEQILKPEYDHIDTHYNQLLGRKGNTYFHYDIGTKVLKPIGSFESAYIAQNGQVIAKIPAGYMLPLSDNPNQIYQDLQPVSDGAIISHEPSGYGLINRKGDYILEPILDTLKHLEGEFFYGYNENQYMLLKATEDDADIRYSSYHKITLENDVILEYIHGRLRRIMKNDGILLDIMGMDHVTRIDKDHYNVYFKNGRVGLLDSKGVWRVVPCDSVTSILPGQEELYGALKDRHFGFVNRAGKLVIPNKFEAVNKFSEGLAGVKLGNLWGYTDRNGTTVISPQYDEVGEFHRGVAIIKKDGRVNLLDKSGKELLPQYYEQISLSDDQYYITEQEGLYGIIDPLGKEITAPIFESLRREGYDKIIVQKNNKFGILNESGELSLPVYYQNILIDNGTQKILAEDIYTPPVLEEAKGGRKKKKKSK
ncbi:WG repeat-containing protein [Echinicola sp. CAU 1574]|uniref:WG repeat-containing protein n=1 Tax=Echinicola arenosa TaxID=2774144 RepID=A0ABR9ARX1_9BACT|nr:WG repeat-containing protein [Echinicola arenosa]MBD8490369.1 WG repeat-containing protein [Echinicola arenosa]